MFRIMALVAASVAPALSAEPSLRPQRVSYKTPDGVQIVADYYPPKTPAEKGAPVAIMLHQYPSTRGSWAPLVPFFHEAGYAVLAPDLRGHGESIEPRSKNLEEGRKAQSPRHYRAAYQDVLGAYEWLRGRKEADLSRLALIGSSIGSSIALDYAARDKSVDVVVCLSPGPNYFGVDSRRHIASYGKRPVLLISPSSECDRSEELAKAAPNATVKIIENCDSHGTFMFGKAPGIEKAIFDFVDSHIGKATKDPVLGSVKGTSKYHKPTCTYANPEEKNAYTISESNLRVFSSAAEAESRGIAPCQRCSGNK
jgi:dienelactone hydrolase